MSMPDWWIWPTLLFLVPLAVMLVWNKVVRHKAGINSNWVLVLFIAVCWITALGMILIEVG